MVKAELVFIPAPGIGHLVATVEIAKLLIERDSRLSVTVVIMKFPFHSTTVNQALTSSTAITDQPRIRFVNLPCDDDPDSDSESQRKKFQFPPFLESQKPHIRDAVSELTSSGSGHDPEWKLAGFVVDMLCTTMIDVANEFGVPTYVFFTSSASFLGVMLHLYSLHDEQNMDIATEFKDPNTELVVPVFTNPVPAKVLPSIVLDKEGGGTIAFLNLARRLREAKGILVNTFMELESHAINSLSYGGTPKLYPVGPTLNVIGAGEAQRHDEEEIMKWLDDQPPSSVVFLCFGSMGSFGPDQVREIAHGLESSGHRFLWSLRQPPTNQVAFPNPTDYKNPQEVLPDGFLERITGLGLGKIIGWAPQVKILAHQAIGGFVSHCGWNSILESLWFGVPIAAWPIYAEQQMNAFEMVRELGLSVEIKLDYRKDFRMKNQHVDVVGADVLERGIRCVMMEHDSEVRKKVEEMKEKSRNSVMVGGSSYVTLGHFIEDVIHNMP